MNEQEHWYPLLNRLLSLHALPDGSLDFSPAAREVYEELLEELGPEALQPKEKGKRPGKHLPAVPTRKEVRNLIRITKPGRDRLVLRLFYASGMRVSELVALKPADVRPDERTLFVRNGKGDKDRYVCVDPKTTRMLERWMTSRPGKDMVFDVEERQVSRIVKKYANKLGLVDKYLSMNRSFSPHSLRHAFATHSYENGMDLFTLRKLLGHQFLSTTEIYIEVAMRFTRKIYRRTHVLCLRRGDDEKDEA